MFNTMPAPHSLFRRREATLHEQPQSPGPQECERGHALKAQCSILVKGC